MPDWSYRTVFRPLFFRLPPAVGRGLCLGTVAALARLPFGGKVIDLLGHMRADPRLRRDVLGVTFPSARWRLPSRMKIGLFETSRMVMFEMTMSSS